MKIKNVWIVFVVALLVTLSARFYQFFFVYDAKAAAYKDGGLLSLFILIVLAVSVILIIIMCSRSKHALKMYQPVKNIPTSVICALTGAAIIFYSFVSMTEIKDKEAQTSLSILGSAAGNGQLQAMQMFLSFLGIVAGLVLLITAYNFMLGTNMFHHFPLVALIPPLWGCVDLAVLFVTDTASVNVAENAFDMFTVIFILLFLFAQSKMFAGIDEEKNAKLAYMFGLPCILLTLVTSLPGGLFRIIGRSTASSLTLSSHIVNVCMAVYVIAFLLSISGARSSDKKPSHMQIAKSATSAPSPIRKL